MSGIKTKYVCYCGKVVLKTREAHHLKTSVHFIRMRQCVLNKNYPGIGKDET